MIALKKISFFELAFWTAGRFKMINNLTDLDFADIANLSMSKRKQEAHKSALHFI